MERHSIGYFLEHLIKLMSVMLIATMDIAAASREEHFRIPGYPVTIKIFLRHRAPAKTVLAKSKGSVLFIHGASFPSALAAAYKFDNHSWMDDLSEAGFDVWALDFAGYGESDRYPEMSQPAEANSPLGRTDIASRQLAAAVNFICERQRVSRVSIVAHSWGTIPSGLYATQEPGRVDRLVLFGPVTLRHEVQPPEPEPAYFYVTIEAQRKRFYDYVPVGEASVMEQRHFEAWGQAYLGTDPTCPSRSPTSVKVPYGPIADANQAWHGNLLYDPARISAPTLIIRGEWDTVTTNDDAHWLYKALRAAPLKRDVVISLATHVMHLEKSRFQLYREVQVFLEANDQ